MKIIENGVVAPKGFTANGIEAGIREGKKRIDLCMVKSEVVANAAAVYTTNLVKAAPIYVTQAHLKDGKAQAMIGNAGNANTCNFDGIEIAEKTCELLAKEANVKKEDIIVVSTGVIGMRMSIKPFENGMAKLVAGLDNKYENSDLAVRGIMTTDTVKKDIAIEFTLGGKTCKMGAMTKGAGMIHPQMATMLCLVTTDAAISSELLDEALKDVVGDSFNMLSVDGDTSTNDTLAVMANGMCGNEMITEHGKDYDTFKEALLFVCQNLARRMAKDGEGASRLLECKVVGAKTKKDAQIVAKSVICSSLFKAAIFGADANWGRVLCAIGYSKADLDINKVDVSFESKKGTILVCKNGAGVEFSEEIAKEILLEDEIMVNVNLNEGKGEALAFGCDLTYEYVKINGDYRS